MNKKALRAFARRHIALDCHSRTTTFSTLFVLLRNDSGGVTRDRPPFVKASGDNSPPPVALCATPPARVPPTRHVARGPGAVGIRTTDATNYCNPFHSWAVGIRPPRPNHPRKLHFRGARYRATPPLDEELCSATGRAKFPSIGGVVACRRGG